MKTSNLPNVLVFLLSLFAAAVAHADTTQSGVAPTDALQLTRDKVASALTHYAHGEQQAAADAALGAHLDGFEYIEASLATVAPELVAEVEEALTDLTMGIDARVAVAELETIARKIEHELQEVEEVLSQSSLSGQQAAAASFVILLREGIEAVLVIAAIAAFLRKTDRRGAMPYVHGGWISALALGGVTWFAATRLIEISGANRELTEGFTALVAAGMLLYVGFWLHNSNNSARWRHFVGDKLDGVAASQRVWPFTLVAFFAVYREVFETVLFYQTLWLQIAPAERHFLLLGFLAAAGTLILLSWAVFRMSVKLPLKAFFTANGVLLVVLAVIFSGKGIVALQEAGLIPHNPVAFPQISMLGIYPDLQSLMVQAAIILSAIAVVYYGRMAAVRSYNSPK